MEWIIQVVSWSIASTEPGELCAMMDGTILMPVLLADNLGSTQQVGSGYCKVYKVFL